jgi:hypothetical protein
MNFLSRKFGKKIYTYAHTPYLYWYPGTRKNTQSFEIWHPKNTQIILKVLKFGILPIQITAMKCKNLEFC